MIEKIDIKIQRIEEVFTDISLPEYATQGSSGLDIRAAVENEFIISAGKVGLVPTNIRVEIPEGFEIQVRPRSGLAAKYGIGILNSPGTIDSDYRGEIKVIIKNLSEEIYNIIPGQKIAQILIQAVSDMKIKEQKIVDETEREANGFGSTGKF